MRADYGLYVVAIICFIMAALPYTNELLKLDDLMSLTLTVIFAALGLIFAIFGYASRPKPIISIPETPKPALPPSEPAPPTLPQEKTTKPERKKPKTKTRRKKTKRQREKA